MHKHCFDIFKKLPKSLTSSHFQDHGTNCSLCLKNIDSECVTHRLPTSSEKINKKGTVQVLPQNLLNRNMGTEVQTAASNKS